MRRGRNEVSAMIQGGRQYPNIRGKVTFVQTRQGVMVTAQINGLPNQSSCCRCGVYGFHIHAGTSCKMNEAGDFEDSLGHYNPKDCPHPYHAGDMPPLFGNDGYAYMSFLTNRFTLNEIIGKVVIIHSNPDDFTTQPNGNSGNKIACGKITM